MIPFYTPEPASLDSLPAETRELLFQQVSNVEQLPKGLYLTVYRGALGLAHGAYPKQKPVTVDFLGGSARHRQQFGGGRSQAIAKAVGLAQNRHLRIMDATAGLGRDAFVMAGLGARVWMLERHPIVRLLLNDGLSRARLQSPKEVANLFLCDGSLTDSNLAVPEPDVVYLDPMFPERRNTAAVKKEMSLFHELVGRDEDADGLLEPALALAGRRVVVKRPRIAPVLANREPSYALTGKSSRFDVYALRSITAD